MTYNKTKRDQQIENLLVAQAMFKDIPEEQIYLGSWANHKLMQIGREGPQLGIAKDIKPQHTCGSVGCFGGWIAVHPHFVKQGVRPCVFDGSPEIPGKDKMYSHTVSTELFGYDNMFDSEFNFVRSNPKKEIMARIEHALNKLTQD